ncbi:MAG TPA: complex I NDUFA9 subunit family protein [Casimicrobiaceae bacterium]|nr:complex I NDUFA9 subunit family protein [Casimicrobiaceae bacterium]
MADGSVLVLGGSGFVGRHVVNRLVQLGMKVVVPTRRRENARHLILLPTVEVQDADIHDPPTLARLAARSSAVVNLVGILNESGRDSFARVHAELAAKVIAACRGAGVRRLVQMSSLNADPEGPSRYQRSKGEAEAAIAASGLDWTIFEPSVIFGREDRFLNLFASLVRLLPVMALARAHTRFQPVYVGDVAHCFAHALADDATVGQRYRLCGPDVYTLRELVAYVGKLTGHERPILELPDWAGRLQARFLELVPGTPMSRDNLASMEVDSVCNCDFPAVFGIAPTALAALAPTYLGPAAARSAYDAYRSQGGR